MGVFCCIYLIQVFISMGRKIKVRLTEQELIDLITKQLSGQDSMDILKGMLSGVSKDTSKLGGKFKSCAKVRMTLWVNLSIVEISNAA